MAFIHGRLCYQHNEKVQLNNEYKRHYEGETFVHGVAKELLMFIDANDSERIRNIEFSLDNMGVVSG